MCGVSTATLRAWERRYGVPSPARTASAYRLYTDADVTLIKTMRDLVSNGMAAAEAARAVLSQTVQAPPPPVEGVDPYEAARDRIVDAALRFDPEGLELEVNRTLSLGPAATIFDKTLGPAMGRIGDLWHQGSLTVAQEHMATQIVMGSLIDLLRLAQPADSTRRVALACFAEEDHTLGLYGVALRFASWGFRTLMIGPRTPPAAVARVVDALAPDVVALSATITPSPPYGRELVDAYADACRSTVWIVGGAAVDGIRSWIEVRGGLINDGDMSEMRRTIDKALVERRRRPMQESR